MSRVPNAAFDPIFFLHHCNIDRLFTLWRLAFPRQPGSNASTEPTIPPGDLTPFVRPATMNGGTWTGPDLQPNATIVVNDPVRGFASIYMHPLQQLYPEQVAMSDNPVLLGQHLLKTYGPTPATTAHALMALGIHAAPTRALLTTQPFLVFPKVRRVSTVSFAHIDVFLKLANVDAAARFPAHVASASRVERLEAAKEFVEGVAATTGPAAGDQGGRRVRARTSRFASVSTGTNRIFVGSVAPFGSSYTDEECANCRFNNMTALRLPLKSVLETFADALGIDVSPDALKRDLIERLDWDVFTSAATVETQATTSTTSSSLSEGDEHLTPVARDARGEFVLEPPRVEVLGVDGEVL